MKTYYCSYMINMFSAPVWVKVPAESEEEAKRKVLDYAHAREGYLVQYLDIEDFEAFQKTRKLLRGIDIDFVDLTEPDQCQYNRYVGDVDGAPCNNMCFAFYEGIERDDRRVWGHFPECKEENCPRLHPEILKRNRAHWKDENKGKG